jgi:hypothetical protein
MIKTVKENTFMSLVDAIVERLWARANVILSKKECGNLSNLSLKTEVVMVLNV